MGTGGLLNRSPVSWKKKDGYEVVGKGKIPDYIYQTAGRCKTSVSWYNIKSSDIKSVEVIQNPGAT